jgi:hypothetical protein
MLLSVLFIKGGKVLEWYDFLLPFLGIGFCRSRLFGFFGVLGIALKHPRWVPMRVGFKRCKLLVTRAEGMSGPKASISAFAFNGVFGMSVMVAY